MGAICDFAHQYDLRILEDCAQSHGAKLAGQMTAPSERRCLVLSYENLGAVGDASAVG